MFIHLFSLIFWKSMQVQYSVSKLEYGRLYSQTELMSYIKLRTECIENKGVTCHSLSIIIHVAWKQ